jgi:undecaprenyl-diphosphatase
LDLNRSIFDAINGLAGRAQVADRTMAWTARWTVFAIVAIIAVSWFVGSAPPTDRRIAVYTAVGAAVAGVLVSRVIQHVYVYPRPFETRANDMVVLLPHAPGASFPPDNSTAAFAMAAGVSVYRARLGAILFALAAAVGLSRVYAGVHYPADVLAGAGIGVCFGAALGWAQPPLTWMDRVLALRLPVVLR